MCAQDLHGYEPNQFRLLLPMDLPRPCSSTRTDSFLLPHGERADPAGEESRGGCRKRRRWVRHTCTPVWHQLCLHSRDVPPHCELALATTMRQPLNTAQISCQMSLLSLCTPPAMPLGCKWPLSELAVHEVELSGVSLWCSMHPSSLTPANFPSFASFSPDEV